MNTEHSSITSLKDYFIDNGINPSFQRLKIYEYLAKTVTLIVQEVTFKTVQSLQ